MYYIEQTPANTLLLNIIEFAGSDIARKGLNEDLPDNCFSS